MGFTNVVWESRSTAQLARDLTDGPGPASLGGAGAAWVRVADELAAVSDDYDKLLDRLQTGWRSESSAAAMHKLDGFRKWLQDMSLAAATNGQRAEEAAVANTEAVLAMPSVSEALAAKDAHDMMASLAAYNGAILNGKFAEFDETARAHHANAAAVMRQYEEAVTALAQPWDQPVVDGTPGGATRAAEDAGKAAEGGAGAAGGAAAAPPPMPLSAWTAPNVESGNGPKALQSTTFGQGQTSAAGMTGMGGMGAGGYAPMGAGSRGGDGHEYESTRPAGILEGGGEQGPGLSDSAQSWLPSAQHNDSDFTVSSVSWGPNSALFDELATPEAPEPEGFADEPKGTLEQVSDRWVSPPVIGDGQVHR